MQSLLKTIMNLSEKNLKLIIKSFEELNKITKKINYEL